MRRAFYDQVDCFRVRRDPTGIPTDPPESLLNMATNEELFARGGSKIRYFYVPNGDGLEGMTGALSLLPALAPIRRRGHSGSYFGTNEIRRARVAGDSSPHHKGGRLFRSSGTLAGHFR